MKFPSMPDVEKLNLTQVNLQFLDKKNVLNTGKGISCHTVALTSVAAENPKYKCPSKDLSEGHQD
jgi:hypothetical protein